MDHLRKIVLCLALLAPPAWAGEAPPAEVAIRGYAFAPATLRVKAGTTVSWTNGDEDAHAVTADDGGWASPGLEQGERFAHRFDRPGRYPYHCALHPHMKAEVVVR